MALRGDGEKPGQLHTATETNEEEALKQIIRETSDYKDFVRSFEELKKAKKKGIKEADPSDWLRLLAEAIKKWPEGDKKTVAQLFIIDQKSGSGAGETKKTKGSKKGVEDLKAIARQEGETEFSNDEARNKPGREKAKKTKGMLGVAEVLEVTIPEKTIDGVPAAEKTEKKVESVVSLPVFTEEALKQDLATEPEVVPSATEPTVEAIHHVIEEVAERQQETGQVFDLAFYRQALREWFPSLAVRKGFEEKDTGKKYSNMDGNACLFFFRHILGFEEGTEEEKNYVNKDVVYVAPGKFQEGALNLDTSPGVHGGLAEAGTGFIDHHGPESERQTSAFQILYDQFREAGALDKLSAQEKQALEKLSQFVTFIDSYTLPTGFRWKEAWENSPNSIFGLSLAYQNNIPIAALFEFFKTHPLEDAWRGLEKFTEPYLEKFKDSREGWKREKDKTDRFVKEITERPNPLGFVVETKALGKILVQIQKDFKEKKSALQFSALANGLDGILVWEPGSGTFFLATGPQKEVTPELMNKIGEGVLVRKSLVKKGGKDRKNTLGSLLQSLGVMEFTADVKKIVEQTETATGNVAGAPEVATPQASPESKEKQEREEFKQAIRIQLKANNGRLPDSVYNWNFVKKLVANWYVLGDAIYEYYTQDVQSEMITHRNFNGTYDEIEGKLFLVLETHPDKTLADPDLSRWFGLHIKRPLSEAEAGVSSVPESSPTEAEADGETFRPEEPPTQEEEEDGEEEYRPDLEKLRSWSESSENTEDTSARLDEKRAEYVRIYQDYLKAKINVGRLEKLKILFKLNKKEAKPSLSEEEKGELKQKLIDVRNSYLSAKQDHARALFQEKAKELAESGLSPEEVTAELNRFSQKELFEKLIVGEELALQAAQSAEWPPKEKGILRKGLDWYLHQHWTVRTLINAGILTGALFAFSSISVGAAAGYFGKKVLVSGTAAFTGLSVGKGVDMFLGRSTQKFVENELKKTVQRALEHGEAGYVYNVFERMWMRQNRVYEQKKYNEKLNKSVKIFTSVATSVGVALFLGGMLFPKAGAAAEQAASVGKGVGHPTEATGDKAGLAKVQTTGAKEATLQGKGAVAEQGAGAAKSAATTAAETGTPSTGQGAEAEPTVSSGARAGINEPPGAGGTPKGAVETLSGEAAKHLEKISTLGEKQGMISLLRQQLEDNPAKFGFDGDVNDGATVHSWAEHQSSQAAIQNNYWDPQTGDQTWFRWDANHPMRFVLEGDAKHGFKVQEIGTEGRSFIHYGDAGTPHPAPLPEVHPAPTPAPTLVHPILESEPALAQPEVPVVEAPLSPEPIVTAPEVPVPQDFSDVAFYPKPVQPYAQYLTDEIKAAQKLAAKYAQDSIFGDATSSVLNRLADEAIEFQEAIDRGDFQDYLTAPKINATEHIRDLIEGRAGASLPEAGAVEAEGHLEGAVVFLAPQEFYIGEALIKLTSDLTGVHLASEIPAYLEQAYAQASQLVSKGFFVTDYKFDDPELFFRGITTPSVRLALTQMDIWQKALEQVPEGSAYAKALKEGIRQKMESIVNHSSVHDVNKIFNYNWIDKFWKK